MQVTYDANVCIHAGNCVKVFRQCLRSSTGSL